MKTRILSYLLVFSMILALCLLPHWQKGKYHNAACHSHSETRF